MATKQINEHEIYTWVNKKKRKKYINQLLLCKKLIEEWYEIHETNSHTSVQKFGVIIFLYVFEKCLMRSKAHSYAFMLNIYLIKNIVRTVTLC